MPNVVRFALPTARTLYVRGAGTFQAGVLDVPVSKPENVARARYLLPPYGAVEVGTVDSATPLPSLPAAPGEVIVDPYPQYATIDEIVASPAVKSAFEPAARNTLAALADSIGTYDQGTSTTRVTHNLLGVLTVNSGQRVRHSSIWGTGGFTLAQIRDTHLPSVLAASPRPAACLIAGGTNDASNQVPGFAALKDIIAALLAAGIRPVLWLVPPREDSAKGTVGTWNARVRALAAREGYQVLDGYSSLVAPGSGNYKAADLKQDQIHPSAKGHGLIAASAISEPGWLTRFPNNPPYLTAAIGDAVNLIPSDQGLFTGDLNSDGVSNGWATWGTSNYTASRVTDADGYVWQRLTKTPAMAGQGGLQFSVSSGFAIGDNVSIACRIRTSASDLPATAVVVDFMNGSTRIGGFGGVYDTLGVIWDGISYAESTVPVNCTSLRLNIQVSPGTVAADAYVEVARVTLLNRTALGIA